MGKPGLARAMKWLCLVVLAVAVSVAGSAAAHPGDAQDHVQHMQINRGTLDAGANVTYHVNFMAQPLEEGWILIVEGVVSGPVDVHLTHDGAPVAAWHWLPGPLRANSTALPVTAEYEITLVNVGDEPVDYRFTYDQTCECAAKFISINGGAVFFNWYLEAGDLSVVDYNLTYLDPAFNMVDAIDGLRMEAALARQVGAGGSWPEDFEILDSLESEGPFSMSFEAPESDRYVVWMRASYDAMDGHSVLVLPFMDLMDEEPVQESPGLPVAATALVLAALAVARRR